MLRAVTDNEPANGGGAATVSGNGGPEVRQENAAAGQGEQGDALLLHGLPADQLSPSTTAPHRSCCSAACTLAETNHDHPAHPAGLWSGPDEPAYTGTIEVTEVEVAAAVPGRLVEVIPAEGDAVRAGDTVFAVDTTTLEADASDAGRPGAPNTSNSLVLATASRGPRGPRGPQAYRWRGNGWRDHHQTCRGLPEQVHRKGARTASRYSMKSRRSLPVIPMDPSSSRAWRAPRPVRCHPRGAGGPGRAGGGARLDLGPRGLSIQWSLAVISVTLAAPSRPTWGCLPRVSSSVRAAAVACRAGPGSATWMWSKKNRAWSGFWRSCWAAGRSWPAPPPGRPRAAHRARPRRAAAVRRGLRGPTPARAPRRAPGCRECARTPSARRLRWAATPALRRRWRGLPGRRLPPRDRAAAPRSGHRSTAGCALRPPSSVHASSMPVCRAVWSGSSPPIPPGMAGAPDRPSAARSSPPAPRTPARASMVPGSATPASRAGAGPPLPRGLWALAGSARFRRRGAMSAILRTKGRRGLCTRIGHDPCSARARATVVPGSGGRRVSQRNLLRGTGGVAWLGSSDSR